MNQHPVSLKIDYPERSDRLTVFFRFLLVIPVFIILILLTSVSYDSENASEDVERVYSAGIVFAPTLLMIVFRQKYPRWWFDWNLALTGFSLRVASYVLLLRDEYPSTDEAQSVHVTIPYPDVEKDLERWMPLVKWFLIIPHVIVLGILLAGVTLCTFPVWFIILFTGRYPRSIFDFIVGFLRWSLRVYAYAFLLTTDIYPQFSLQQ
jgi:hypothetical protein